MVEVMAGGKTSFAAQLQYSLTPNSKKVMLREATSPTYKARELRLFALGASGDFPQHGSWLPVKGSTAAHLFDRQSNIDQRSEAYGLPNSFLRPGHAPTTRLYTS